MPKINHISEIQPEGGYSRAAAARVLGVSEASIYNRLKHETKLLKTSFFGVKELIIGESIIKLYEDRTGKSL